MPEDSVKIISVKELPLNIKKGDIFNIDTSDVSYYTHGFFKYPCKFIPQIPTWSFRYFEKTHKNNNVKLAVYDPFMGSGTTLVEASLEGYDYAGSDIDPLGRLLSIVKSEKYTKKDIENIRLAINQFIRNINLTKAKDIPEIPNIQHWFSTRNMDKMGKIKFLIDNIKDAKSRNFMSIVFASIIRKSSRADEMSPKPYISTRFKKEEIDPVELFEKKAEEYYRRLLNTKYASRGKNIYIGEDARKSSMLKNTIDLAVTSPPYINAFDYVRTLKLENYWLGLTNEDVIKSLRVNNVGTETILKDASYRELAIPVLRDVVGRIHKVDVKRSKIVDKYFDDMSKNIADVHRVLKPGGKYVIVVADSVIRSEHVPTKNILIEIAKKNGFNYDSHFGYVIRNRYLRIPRSGRGGFMKVDWVIVLEKKA